MKQISVLLLYSRECCLFLTSVAGIFLLAAHRQRLAPDMCLKSSEAHWTSFFCLRKKAWDVTPISPQEKVKPFQHMFSIIYVVWQWKGKFSQRIYGTILSHLSSVYFTLSHCSENYNEMAAPNVEASHSSILGHCGCCTYSPLKTNKMYW